MALMQIAEPEGSADKSKKNAIGIDLGTTNSLVATVVDGEVEIIKDSQDRAILPSVIYFGLDDQVLVGSEALIYADSNPTDTLISVKRFLGRSRDDLEEIASMYNLSAESDGIRFITGSGAISPIQASAEILAALTSRAKNFLQGEVIGAVITVPAYFDDAQRQATKDAARIAGINVLRLLNEPTAAALAYGLQSRDQGTIAVYDLGGGTFDISILRLHDGVFEVLATGGDAALGGDDIDLILYDWCLSESKIDETDLSARRRILRLVKAAKELLSTSELASIDLSFLSDTTQIHELQLETFEELVAPLIRRTISTCRRCLGDAKLKTSDIDNVIFVGGSTRVRCVRREVSRFFDREPLDGIDPEMVVAIGAAQQANVLVGNSQNDSVLLIDVIPLSLGIETMGGLVEKIISRNTAIPVVRSQEFTTYQDGQTGLVLHVLQGERELVDDCRSLAKFELKGIPPMAAGAARIDVTFEVDADGLLSVTAMERTTKVEASINIKPTLGLEEEEITLMLESSFSNAQGDVNTRRAIEQQVESKHLLDSLSAALHKDGQLLLDDIEKKDLESRMKELKTLLEIGDNRKIEEVTALLARESEVFAMKRMDRTIKSALGGKSLERIEQEVKD